MIRAKVPIARVARFDECGHDAWLFQNQQDGSLKIVAHYCHDRLCVPCARARSRAIAANLSRQLHGKTFRFVTLTLKSTATPLAAQIHRLYDAFKRLRRLPIWANATTGGAAVLEITYNDHTHLWHPHLHIICEGKWIQNTALSHAWLACTGDSWIIDIRLVKPDFPAADKPLTDRSKVIDYLAKYAAKGYDNSCTLDRDACTELVTALHGTHLLFAFGTWRGFHLNALPEHTPDDGTWRPISPLRDILRRAAQGDPWCTRLVNVLTKGASECIPHNAGSSP